MTKLAITLRRRDDATFEEFREHYLEEHAPLAADLPGLERYTVSFPNDPDDASYDALAELYFADDEAMAESFASEIGREVTADAETFADMDAAERVVLEEHVEVA
ncbi:EthD family reductase [Halobaculum sp. CBA1158]|uniref:EthD family reductase n=1 Tax=Halobaculum sp. CBA1158 TaxID=2904243 RepID=UPI001F3A4346|nr:EthD family reductase [Halobaculum sp. CBA1158]UIP00782.1 EthD family reductase [Halobaculum sp. CBA1158]